MFNTIKYNNTWIFLLFIFIAPSTSSAVAYDYKLSEYVPDIVELCLQNKRDVIDYEMAVEKLLIYINGYFNGMNTLLSEFDDSKKKSMVCNGVPNSSGYKSNHELYMSIDYFIDIAVDCGGGEVKKAHLFSEKSLEQYRDTCLNVQ